VHSQSRLPQERSVGAVTRRSTTRVGTIIAVALGAGTLAACGGGGEIRAESGEVIASGSWSVFDLEVGDCIDDAGAEGDIGDEMPVHNVYMDKIAARFHDVAHVFAKAGKVRRQDRGADL